MSGKGEKYGIVAYGKSFTFHSKKEYEDYLMAWIAGTDGSERDRAVTALSNLRQGYRLTDTDSGKRFR